MAAPCQALALYHEALSPERMERGRWCVCGGREVVCVVEAARQRGGVSLEAGTELDNTRSVSSINCSVLMNK